MASVLAFDTRPKELSEVEALDWLRLQPRGHAPANSAVLAERWGWSRQRVARCLRTWQATGLITRTGKLLTVTVRDDGAVARTAPPVARAAPSVEPSATSTIEPPVTAIAELPAASVAAPPAAP